LARPTERPRELAEVEQGGDELAPETRIAACRDDCRLKALSGGGLVSLGECSARCFEPLGEQRFRVSHVDTLPWRFDNKSSNRSAVKPLSVNCQRTGAWR
jgi:hypothetical protein